MLGLIVNVLSQMPAGRWLMANFLLFAFALFVWTLSAFLALVIRNAAAVLVMVSIVGLFGNELLFRLIPGLAVLCGPMVGRMFDYRSAQAELGAPVILSLAAQFLIGAIFFAAAVRPKYRRPDALAGGVAARRAAAGGGGGEPDGDVAARVVSAAVHVRTV